MVQPSRLSGGHCNLSAFAVELPNTLRTPWDLGRTVDEGQTLVDPAHAAKVSLVLSMVSLAFVWFGGNCPEDTLVMVPTEQATSTGAEKEAGFDRKEGGLVARGGRPWGGHPFVGGIGHADPPKYGRAFPEFGQGKMECLPTQADKNTAGLCGQLQVNHASWRGDSGPSHPYDETSRSRLRRGGFGACRPRSEGPPSVQPIPLGEIGGFSGEGSMDLQGNAERAGLRLQGEESRSLHEPWGTKLGWTTVEGHLDHGRRARVVLRQIEKSQLLIGGAAQELVGNHIEERPFPVQEAVVGSPSTDPFDAFRFPSLTGEFLARWAQRFQECVGHRAEHPAFFWLKRFEK